MKKDKSIILATDKDGNEITIEQVEEWIKDKNHYKKNLSQFIYDRLYGRYIKPFDFDNPIFVDKYKNGFSIMANSCLLIETYASFREKVFRDTNHKSQRCFGWFFLTEKRFSDFSKGGLALHDYLDIDKQIRNKGVPRDFYLNVRCGILHNAETRNGWKITRRDDFYDKETKTINAVKFMNRLKATIDDYRKQLIHADISMDDIWDNCIYRIQDIISSA